MPEVMEAFAAHQAAERRAQEVAREIRWRGQAILGRAILAEQDRGTQQKVIAGQLERTREQVRRWQAAYREWLEEFGTEP